MPKIFHGPCENWPGPPSYILNVSLLYVTSNFCLLQDIFSLRKWNTVYASTETESNFFTTNIFDNRCNDLENIFNSVIVTSV